MHSLRVRPRKPIEPGASMVNHITNEMVERLPYFDEHPDYASLKETIEGSVVIAHNAVFDIQVLKRAGIDVREYVCTKELAKILYPNAEMHRLQYLRYWLRLPVAGDAHTAEGDVAVLRALWEHMTAGAEEAIIKKYVKRV